MRLKHGMSRDIHFRQFSDVERGPPALDLGYEAITKCPQFAASFHVPDFKSVEVLAFQAVLIE